MIIQDLAAKPIAVVCGKTNRSELPKNIRALFDKFYQNVPRERIGPPGLNVVLYHGVPGRDLFQSEEGMPIEVGVLVDAPFESGDGVVCSATPAGTVATVTHIGPYEGLISSYQTITAWCKENRREFAGPFWEIYGHWTNDSSKLRTDVFRLLK